jgi:hypothetical protein
MHRRFLAAIDAAVDRALPAGWPRLPRPWLPARGSVQARHAFRLANDTGPRPYLVVVAVPPFAARTAAVEGNLLALVDRILARGGTLLLLYEHESDPNGWVRERLDFPHPRFLCLPCAAPRGAPGPPRDGGDGFHGDGGAGRDGGGDGRDSTGGGDSGNAGDSGDAGEDYTVAPTWNRTEPLSGVIRDLWSGDLFYRGPCEGPQTVGVEIMKDACWRCRFSLDTVTGIVFPDREVADWSRPDWAYYQALLQLARMPDPIIPTLSAAVEAWRAAGDRRLTVIRWRYSKTVEYAYWAAECTACGAFQGDFPLMEERMQLLDDLDSRRTGILSYRPLPLVVPRQALQELTWGMEVNPHARFLGWYRAGDPDLERTTETGYGLPGAAGAAAWERRSPELRAATAIRSTVESAGERTAAADLGLPSAAAAGGTAVAEAAAGYTAIAEAPAACAAVPAQSPVQRLGEILAAWLGWFGAARRPQVVPGAPGIELSDGPPAAAEAVNEVDEKALA